MSARCLGVVLAGGTGSRVGGADKGLLPLCGRPLIEHVLDILRPQCDALLIVANRNLDEYSRFATAITDEVEGHAGPLAGIVAALEHAGPSIKPSPPNPPLEGEGLLLTVPVDCPRPPHDLRERLQSALTKSDDASCTFAHDGRSAQPLFALYRLSQIVPLLARARSALDSHASVLRWHQEIDARAVNFSDWSAAFHNLNAPQDFRDYQREHG